MTNPPVPDEPLDEPRSRSLQGVEHAVFALLLIVMIGQTAYLLTFTRNLREAQEALACQDRVTEQLRSAAAIERQAQRDLLTSILSPAEAAPEQRRENSRAALTRYLTSLNAADADRAAVPRCPELPR